MFMHNNSIYRRQHLAMRMLGSLPFIAMLLAGCSSDRISESVAELNAFIQLDVPVKSAKWEVFYMPEAGGLPAPTDYIFLVAEIEPGDARWFASRPAHWTKAYAMPEAARGWMSGRVRTQLLRLTRQSQDGAPPSNCKDLRAKMTQSGRPVPGFACAVGDRLLIHIKLQDNTGMSDEGSPE